MRPLVLFLTDQRERMGGMEEGFLELLTSLDRRRFELAVAGPPGPLLEEAGRVVPVFPSAISPFQTKPAAGAIQLLVRQGLAFKRRLLPSLKPRPPHLVHTVSFGAHLYGAILARSVGSQLLWDVQDYFPHRFERFLLRSLSHIRKPYLIFLGKETARRFPAVRKRGRREVAGGVDLKRFSLSRGGSSLRRERGIAPGAPVAGYLGQLIPRKRVHVLLEAAALARERLRGLHLVIVGAPSPQFPRYAQRLFAEGERRGGWVHFLGRRTDPEALLPDFDVLLFPSREEPFGRVVLEAMASRAAVIALPTSGVAEALPQEAFLSGADGSSESLAEALVSLLGRPGNRERLAGRGRRVVEEQFLAEARAAKIEEVYGEILGL